MDGHGRALAVDVWAALEAVTARGASYRVDLDRDQAMNAFRLEVTPLRVGLVSPPRDALLPLLPPGSRWAPARGWWSLFGRGVVLATGSFWALGMEEIRTRDDGAAYPVARFYLSGGPTPPVSPLLTLATVLDPGGGDVTPIRARVVLRRLPGSQPEASRQEQGWILRQAAELSRQGRRPMFRTAVLSEDELRPWLALRSKTRQGGPNWDAIDACVLGVPDVLAARFNPMTTALYQLRSFWQPG